MSSLCFVASCDQGSFPNSLHCHLQQQPILWKERTSLGKNPKTPQCGWKMWICVTLCVLLGSLHLLRVPNPNSQCQARPRAAPAHCRELAAQESDGLKAKNVGIWNKSRPSQIQHIIYSSGVSGTAQQGECER